METLREMQSLTLVLLNGSVTSKVSFLIDYGFLGFFFHVSTTRDTILNPPPPGETLPDSWIAEISSLDSNRFISKSSKRT